MYWWWCYMHSKWRLKERYQLFIYYKISTMEKFWAMCMVVVGKIFENDKMWCKYVVINCVHVLDTQAGEINSSMHMYWWWCYMHGKWWLKERYHEQLFIYYKISTMQKFWAMCIVVVRESEQRKILQDIRTFQSDRTFPGCNKTALTFCLARLAAISSAMDAAVWRAAANCDFSQLVLSDCYSNI